MPKLKTLAIKKLTRARIPRLPWQKLKDRALGRRYELSVVFCGNALARRLNRVYRGKDEPANVLAFPLSETSGEIFINVRKGEHIVHLYIHALLHLKGLPHGRKMDKMEMIYDRKHYHGH